MADRALVAPRRIEMHDRPPGRDELSRGAKTFVLLVFALALVVAVLGAWEIDARRTDQRRGELQDSAQAVAGEAADRLGAAVTAVQRISLVTVASWPSPAEFEAAFAEHSAALPEEAAASVVIGVSAEQLDTFVQAERRINPQFRVSSGNRVDIRGDHLLVMRSLDETLIGTDLTEEPEAARFTRLPAVGMHVFGIEGGTADDADAVQFIVRSKAEGPDDTRHDSWTVVSFDLDALFGQVHEAGATDLGIRLAIGSVGEAGPYGVDRSNAGGAVIERIPVGPVDLDVEVWSDASSARTLTMLMYLAAAIAAGAVALVAYLALALSANRRRASVQSEQARRDHLTGIPNRRWAVEYLSDLEGESVAVLFCDLDRFKVVNDSAGHSAGDGMLLQVVDRLQSVLDETCSVARFGGDEFLVVCTGPEDIIGHASHIAERINKAMSDPFAFGSSEFTTTMSIGIAAADRLSSVPAAELIRAADVALGLCKQRGRNGVVVYDDRLREAELDRLELERDLRTSLDRGEMVIHYQPIVAVDGSVVSFEALVRWQRNGELVSPVVFLPVVEEIDRMRDLGEIVLRQSVRQFARGIDPAGALTLHVNVHPHQLTDPAFTALVKQVLTTEGLPAGRLILELTEGEWAESIERVTPVLDELAEFGVRFAIDDFGAGYSNIGRALAVTGVAEIKLDRSLVRDMFQARNHAFVTGFTETMTRIGVAVIAEGIETVEDFACVKRSGVTRFQGYLFARPGPAGETDFRATSGLGPVMADRVIPELFAESYNIPYPLSGVPLSGETAGRGGGAAAEQEGDE